ncbi:DUF6932 family protein [Paenibacillus sp. HW567]|uniref:DUF6932 family protein n=1 Tax=Paenibacillus sp. HW567 TaxID=1034769 RepID=UPI000365B6C3|nr:hypothetical protein [Paenibacillus sp. HW567]
MNVSKGPVFNLTGNLEPGLHWMEWSDFVHQFGFSQKRVELISGLQSALNLLKIAGCKTVYIDGSFASTKEIPGDFDACWEEADTDLAILDPVFFDFNSGRAAQKAKFKGEFFPGELMEGGSKLTFLNFFQRDKRTGEAKGIIAIDLRRLP